MSPRRPFKDASPAGLLADLPDQRNGLERLRLTLLIGDKLADAARYAALDDAADTELIDNAIALGELWRYMRGTTDAED